MGSVTATADRSTIRNFTEPLALIGAITASGFRRFATYRQATIAGFTTNIMFGFLLIFTGANVPVSALPGWMQSVSNVLPFTHGIEAAREVADGASLADVSDLLGVEILIGVGFGTLGYVFIRSAERWSLSNATLDRA